MANPSVRKSYTLGVASGRLQKARSTGDVSTVGRSVARKNDSLDKLSKIRDEDFKRTLESKLRRLSKSLTAPANAFLNDTAKKDRQHLAASLRRNYYRSELPDVSVAEERGRDHRLPSIEINFERRPEDFARRPTRQHDTPYHLERLSERSTALQNKGMILLKEGGDVETRRGGGGGRLHGLLEELRDQQFRSSADDFGRLAMRDDVEAFAAVLGRAQLPSSARSYDVLSRRTGGQVDDDIWTRLADVSGDMKSVEGLVCQTFNWTGGKLHSGNVEPVYVNSDVVFQPVTVETSPTFIFYDNHPDYRKTDALADAAVKWAQERRARLEGELEVERRLEQYRHAPPGGAAIRRGSTQHRVADDEVGGISHETGTFTLPTRVRPASALYAPERRSMIDLTVDREEEQSVSARPTLAYKRSASASSVGRPASDVRPLPGYTSRPLETTKQPQMSEARRKAQSVLAKYSRRTKR